MMNYTYIYILHGPRETIFTDEIFFMHFQLIESSALIQTRLAEKITIIVLLDNNSELFFQSLRDIMDL